MASELREAILQELSFEDKADDDIANAILDAVIEALPKQEKYNITQNPNENSIFTNGERTMLLKVKSILQEAKESK